MLISGRASGQKLPSVVLTSQAQRMGSMKRPLAIWSNAGSSSGEIVLLAHYNAFSQEALGHKSAATEQIWQRCRSAPTVERSPRLPFTAGGAALLGLTCAGSMACPTSPTSVPCENTTQGVSGRMAYCPLELPLSLSAGL